MIDLIYVVTTLTFFALMLDVLVVSFDPVKQFAARSS
jgi:hypothetical protein